MYHPNLTRLETNQNVDLCERVSCQRTQVFLFVTSCRHVYMGSQIIIRNLFDGKVCGAPTDVWSQAEMV